MFLVSESLLSSSAAFWTTSIRDICQPWKLSLEMFHHSPEIALSKNGNSWKCFNVNKWVNQWVCTCMQEQSSGTSPRFNQPLEECALSKGCCCQGSASGETQPVLSIPQKGGMWCGIQQPGKTPICFTRNPVPGDSPSATSLVLLLLLRQVGCSSMCTHSWFSASTNNGNKSPNVQSSE